MKKHFVALCLLFAAFFAVLVGKQSQVQAKTYTIGTDVTFPPFVYANSHNKYVGIDMELIRTIAKTEGFKIKIKPVGFNAAVQGVSSGQFDGIISGMTITKEREKTFQFSTPYYESGIVMAVAPKSNIKSLKDLKGKRVAVKTGT
ncbi:transporter substrate-binding domain-containing protein, partial [Liquorilactobacillus vini]